MDIQERDRRIAAIRARGDNFYTFAWFACFIVGALLGTLVDATAYTGGWGVFLGVLVGGLAGVPVATYFLHASNEDVNRVWKDYEASRRPQ